MVKIFKAMKKYFKVNNKLFLFLTILFVIGIISGSIFCLTISDIDGKLVTSFLNSYMSSIKNNTFVFKDSFINYLSSNIFLNVITWLLGFSVIGIPIILFLFFYKCFSIGFSITAILNLYKSKGILLAFIYVFPHQIINILIYMILIIYAYLLSLNILNAVIKRKEISFKNITFSYFLILIISSIIIVLLSLYEAYVLPKIIRIILKLDI